MIKYGEPNPLNVFDLRRMQYCSPHLERVHFDCKTHDRAIIDWIYENLAGRFYYNDEIVEQSTGVLTAQKCAAFEIHSEATLFCFALETLNKSNFAF